jgi:hypothetical protein
MIMENNYVSRAKTYFSKMYGREDIQEDNGNFFYFLASNWGPIRFNIGYLAGFAGNELIDSTGDSDKVLIYL